MISDARWITLSSLPTLMPESMGDINGSILFRKEFDIKPGLVSAKLSVCALGLGFLTINGCPATDEELSTPYTAYDKRVIYREYDILNLLHPGPNCIGEHVGNGFYNDNMKLWNDYFAPWKDVPKLLLSLDLHYEDGAKETINSDPSWKAIAGPSIYNHMRQGEMFDARLYPSGFDKPGFADEAWSFVKIAHEPGGKLLTTNMPPIRVKEVIKPIALLPGGIYDFGVNMAGWAKITLSGTRGQQIKLSYDEALDEEGNLLQNCNCYAKRENMPLVGQDIFICSGQKKESFRPHFCYHGFRYVKVENAPSDFCIVAELAHTDCDEIGSFSCDDAMLGSIHEATRRATLSNLFGISTDCPHREQNGWTGDAQLACEQALMNFDLSTFYFKWLQDFQDAMRPNGQLPGIVPSSGWGYNWGSGPAWDSALIVIPYQVYLHTRRTDILMEMWPYMVRYTEYFLRQSPGGIACFGLGDWCSPKGHRCPSEVTDTAYLYYDLTLMANIAELLALPSKEYKEKAAIVRAAWRDAFLGREDMRKYQTFFATAIYMGLLDASEEKEFARILAGLIAERDYHFECGILGIKFIFQSLSEHGFADVLYKAVTNPTFPSYAYWILKGQTTLCEDWDMSGSLNHYMFGEVDNWFYRYLAGFRYEKEGLVINPVYLPELDHVQAEQKGIAKVERKGKAFSVLLLVSARIIISGKDLGIKTPGEYRFLLE